MVLRRSLLSLTLLMLAACNQNQSADSTAALTTDYDACTIALAGDDQSDNDKKIRQYQTAVTASGQPLVNLEKLGWAYISLARRSYDQGYYQLALETAKCIDSKHANHDASLMLQAYTAHQLHQFKLAGQLAQKLIDKRGYWFDYGLLGDALMEQGQLDDAEQAYQTMMNQRPGPQAYSRAAHLRWLKGDLPGAIEIAKLTVTSYGYGSSETASWAKTKLAHLMFLNGELSETRLLIEQTLDLNRDYTPALFLKSRLLLEQGLVEDAIVILKKAVELNPQSEYLWTLFEALQGAGMYAQAGKVKSQFKQSAHIEDPRTYAIYLAGSSDDIALSLKLAKQVLEERQDIFSHDAMAWALYANNKTNKALIHIEKALADSTHDARLFYHAALIYFSQGKSYQALEWFEKAIKNQYLLLPSEQHDLQKTFAKFSSQNVRTEKIFTFPITTIN